MRRVRPILLVVAIAASASAARAQPGWELNGHAALLRNDVFSESGNALQTGIRFFRHTASGFAIGANLDWARVGTTTLGDGSGAAVDAQMLLYSGELEYVFPRRGRTRFFLGAGVGGVTTLLDGGGPAANENATGQLFPLAFGLMVNDDPDRPSWGFRLDVRDNLIVVDSRVPGRADLEQEIRSNWEISAGVSYRFGGPRPARSAPEPARPTPRIMDTDRDGVVDARDRCANTPRGVLVDDRGCPIPDEPVAEEPVAEEPVAEEPVAEEPVAEEPVMEEPAVERPRPEERGVREEPVVTEEPAEPAEPAEEPAEACLGTQPWFESDVAIQVLDATWAKIGPPEPINRENLVAVGSHRGITVYVGSVDSEPYSSIWLPVCESGIFQGYVPQQ